MKAAVIHHFGDLPSYEDFADPIAAPGDQLVNVLAVPLENFDKITAQGVHYASKRIFPQFPAIVGHSGVGALADGTLVAFGGPRAPYGAMAEIAVVPQQFGAYVAPIPAGIDPAVAAALPASALTSLLPLKYGAKLEPGHTVLIQGATGVSGKLAIQNARLLGARRIVATGRDASSLESLHALGADVVIDLKQPDDALREAFAREAGEGYNVVLDFLWGRPTELLFRALTPTDVGFPKHKTRYVQIGQAAGASITLLAEALRTSGLEIMGIGNVTPEALQESLQQVWTWVREKKLTIDIETAPLKDIAEAWQRKTTGKRIVITP